MTNAQIEVITSVQRRRRWSRAEKERIVAAALERLREHTSSLDTVVRDEIRTTLIEELHALADNSRHAAASRRPCRNCIGVCPKASLNVRWKW